ncbi:MAG: hypothetical protein ACYS26_16855 [Planctomycetota bacterium]|jgi:hypothetical protein
MRSIVASSLPLAVFCAAAPAFAGTEYEVRIEGFVEFNGVTSGPLGQVNTGDDATITFRVDSDVFVDSGSFPTRGYVIDEASFSLAFPGGSLGLQNPFQGPLGPLFVLRDNDPAVDGFFIADNVNFPTGVALQLPGAFGPFTNNFSVTYGGDLLDSLDIAGAVGIYEFDGLSVFNWTIDDGPFNPVGMIYERMVITEVSPSAIDPLGCGVNPANSLVVLSGNADLGQTLTVGVDNPLGTQGAGSLPLVFAAFAADPASPCGTSLPGLGMGGPGAPGEVLIDLAGESLLFIGGPWAGPGVPEPIQLAIPELPALVGTQAFVQGALVDPVAAGGVGIGLTDGLALTFGFGG